MSGRENIKKKRDIVIIMPIEEIIKSKNKNLTEDEDIMIKSIIEGLMEEINKNNNEDIPYYLFINVELTVPEKDRKTKKFTDRKVKIRPDLILISEKAIIVGEMKGIYGDVRVECEEYDYENKKCLKYRWVNEKTNEILIYENDKSKTKFIEPINQVKNYRGKIWNLLELYLQKKFPNEQQISEEYKKYFNSYIKAYVIFPKDLMITGYDEKVREFLDKPGTRKWFNFVNIKEAGYMLYVAHAEEYNKLRQLIGKDLKIFIKFLKSYTTEETLKLSREDIEAIYNNFNIYEATQSIDNALQGNKSEEIELALKTIDFLGLKPSSEKIYDSVILNENLPPYLRNYALRIIKRNKEEEKFVLYLLRMLEKIRDLEFQRDILTKWLSTVRNKETMEKIVNKISALAYDYYYQKDFERLRLFLNFLRDAQYLSNFSISKLQKMYDETDNELNPYIDSLIKLSKIQIDAKRHLDSLLNTLLKVRYIIIDILMGVDQERSIRFIINENKLMNKLFEYDAFRPFIYPHLRSILKLLKRVDTKNLSNIAIVEDTISGINKIMKSIDDMEMEELFFDVLSRIKTERSAEIFKNMWIQEADKRYPSWRYLCKILECMKGNEYAKDFLKELVTNPDKYPNLIKRYSIHIECVDKAIEILSSFSDEDTGQFMYQLLKNSSPEENIRTHVLILKALIKMGLEKYKDAILQEIKRIAEKDVEWILEDILPEIAGVNRDILLRVIEDLSKVIKDKYDGEFYPGLLEFMYEHKIGDYPDIIYDGFVHLLKNRNFKEVGELLCNMHKLNNSELIKRVLSYIDEHSSELKNNILDIFEKQCIRCCDDFWAFVKEQADDTWYDVLWNLISKILLLHQKPRYTYPPIFDIILNIDSQRTLKNISEMIGGVDENSPYVVLNTLHAFYQPDIQQQRYNIDPDAADYLGTIIRKIGDLIRKGTISKDVFTEVMYGRGMVKILDLYCVNDNLCVSKLSKLFDISEKDTLLFFLSLYPTEKGIEIIMDADIDKMAKIEYLYWCSENELRINIGLGMCDSSCHPEILEYIISGIENYLINTRVEAEEFKYYPPEDIHEMCVVALYYWKDEGAKKIIDMLDKHSSEIIPENAVYLINCVYSSIKWFKLTEYVGDLSRILKNILEKNLKNRSLIDPVPRYINIGYRTYKELQELKNNKK